MNLTQRISSALAMLFGGGGQLSNRNGFVDGAFASWQSGAANPATLSTAALYVGPTMWRVSAGTGGAGTVQQIDLRSSTDLALMEGDETYNAIKVSITTGSSGTTAARTAATIYQQLENVARYAGKSITVQFKLKVDSGTMSIPALICQQNFGSGGSPSAAVAFDKAVSWVVGTSLKKFSVRIDVPAISTKTLGTNSDSSLALGLFLPPGVTGNLTIAEAQVEACSPNANPATDGTGGNPTSFEHRGAAESARVMRFYQSGVYGGYSTTSYIGGLTPWPVPFRANPTFSFNDQNGNTGKVNTTAGSNVSIVAGSFSPSATAFTADAAISAGAGNWWRVAYTADARL